MNIIHLVLPIIATFSLAFATIPALFLMITIVLATIATLKRKVLLAHGAFSCLLFLILVAIAAPWLTEWQVVLGNAHLLGQDANGRDLLRQLMLANRSSLIIALSGSLLTLPLALAVGSTLSMGPPWSKKAVSMLLQSFSALPPLIYYLLGMAFLPAGPLTLILMFGLTLWPEPARMIQVRAAELLQAPFSQVARMQGVSPLQLLFREILPNLYPVLLISGLLTLANGVLLEAILGFLGLGLPLGSPSLGQLIGLGASRLDEHSPLLAVTSLTLLAWLMAMRKLGRNFKQESQPLLANP